MLPPLPLMWQRTSSSWRSPMRSGGSSAARGSRAGSSSAGSTTARCELVVMEACGSAHHWARTLNGPRHRGAAAAGALRARLCEAQQDRRRRCPRAARSGARERHQAGAGQVGRAAGAAGPAPHALGVDGAHAPRASTRCAASAASSASIVPEGAATGIAQIARYLADRALGACPTLLRGTMRLLLEEIRLLEARIGQLERELAADRQASAACQALLSVPGIGLLTSTAMVAAVGDPRSFDSGAPLRKLPRPHAAGTFLRRQARPRAHLQARRPLLAHAAHPRRALGAARRHRRASARAARSIGCRSWALEVQARTNHNKADLRACQQARAHRLGGVD